MCSRQQAGNGCLERNPCHMHTQSFKKNIRNSLFCLEFPLTFMFIHSPFHLLTSLPGFRVLEVLSISLMYSSGFTEESRNKDGTRERGPRAWRSCPLTRDREYCHSSQYHGTVVTETPNAITHRVSSPWSRLIK